MFEGLNIKVLHITESIKGGVATYLNEIYYQQKQALGGDNLFVTSADDAISQLQFCVPENLQFVVKNKRTLRYFWRYYKFIIRVIKIVSPDVIHVHGSFAGFFVRVYRIIGLRKFKVIYSPHGWSFLMDVSSIKKIIYFGVEFVLSFFTYRVINNSKYEHDLSIKYGLSHKRSVMIYHALGEGSAPLNIGDNSNIKNNQINLLFVGRFDFAKGIDVLLQAFSEVKSGDFKLHIAGGSVNHDMMVNIKDDVNIKYYGWLNSIQLSELYSQIDVVVIPSRSEGFGYVALEAMKYSKAVIASNRGALPELVVDNYNGYLFDITSNQALRDIILNLSKEKLVKMGANGHKVFKDKFSSKLMNEKTLELYFKAMGKILEANHKDSSAYS
jgi:glycosyltransferase involved in cell wall biosynthesis